MLTPTVAGTVIMLIAVTVMPIVFDMLTRVPAGAAPLSAPVSALATVLVITGLALKATGPLRLWAPVIGVVTGSLVADAFGLYDVASIGQAAWIDIPNTAWPGFDLSFGPVFWALLPAFVFVTLVGAIETIGDGVAIQRVSWRRPRAVDFRAVQGAVAADGAGNLLSGLAGTVPNTTYSTSIAVTELTGVAARGVGVAIGVIFLALAFLPKALAAVLAIPPPVAAAYITVLLAMLFVTGMKMVIQDGIDYRKGLVVGVSFWAGAAEPGRRPTALAAGRAQGRRRRGAGIRRLHRTREPAGSPHPARCAFRRGPGGAGILPAAVAPPRLIGPSRAIPRHGNRDRPRRHPASAVVPLRARRRCVCASAGAGSMVGREVSWRI